MKKIITFLMVAFFTVCLFGCGSDDLVAKKNPPINNADSVVASIKETVNNKEYTYSVTRGELYDLLKDQIGSTALVSIIDKYLLSSDGKTYLNNVTETEVKKLIDTDCYGKDTKIEDLTSEEKLEKETEFLDTMFISYGCSETSIYGTSIYNQYLLTAAEKAYAKDVLIKEVKDKDDKYAAYEKLSDEEKEAAEDPVTAPFYTDTQVATKYNADHYSEYEAIIVPFTSLRQAEIALSQIGVCIENGLWADATTKAPLTAVEVYNKYVALYELVFGYLPVEADRFKYTNSELTALNANVAARIKNKMTCKTDDSQNTTGQTWYYATPYETGSGSLFAYVLKLNETVVDSYADLDDAAKAAAKVSYLDNLYEDSLTSNYIQTKMAELRKEKNLVIYDYIIEASYAEVCATYNVEYTKTAEESDKVASVDGKQVTVQELYDEMYNIYGIAVICDKLVEVRFMRNPEFNTYYNLDTKEWLDNDVKETIEASLKTEKDSFAAGTYTTYGYDPTTMTWEEYINLNYNVKNDDELMLTFLAQTIMDDYKAKLNYLTYADEDKTFPTELSVAEDSNLWKAIKKGMENTYNDYFKVNGIHLLICAYGNETDLISKSNPVDPEKWTDDQKTKAETLYNEIIAYLNASKGTYAEKFQKVSDAFKYAPISPVAASYDGVAVKTTLTSDDNTVTINVSSYKSAGLNIKFEDLGDFANGSMVEAFNDAVKKIWDADMVTISSLTTEKITQLEEKKEVTTTTLNSAKIVKSLNKETLANEIIKTNFGYHVYLNEASYFNTSFASRTANSDTTVTFRYIPTLEEIRNKIASSVSSQVSTAITTFYEPYATEISGDSFTYLSRFYDLKSISSTFDFVDGGKYKESDLEKFLNLYIKYSIENNLKLVNEEFLG